MCQFSASNSTRSCGLAVSSITFGPDTRHLTDHSNQLSRSPRILWLLHVITSLTAAERMLLASFLQAMASSTNCCAAGNLAARQHQCASNLAIGRGNVVRSRLCRRLLADRISMEETLLARTRVARPLFDDAHVGHLAQRWLDAQLHPTTAMPSALP